MNTTTNRKNTWWRSAVFTAAVLAVAAAGYFLGGEKVKGFFSRGGAPGTEAGHAADAGHGDHGHGHGGGAPTVSVTLWAEKTDIFMERPYAVAGQAIDALVHVTIMHSGAPVTEGSLAFQAVGPDQTALEARAQAPARPGIFIPKVTFPKAGVYQAQVVIQSPQVEGGGETIRLPDVEVYADAEAALAAAAKDEEAEPAEGISYLKEQQWRIGLTTAPAREQELVERLVVPGRVIVPPGSGAMVGSPIGGKVAPPSPEGFPRVGDQVQEGQVLAVVEPSVAGAEAVQMVANQAQLQTLDADLAVKQLEIETKIRSAELALARARDVRDRKQKLTEGGVSAAKDLLAAEHEMGLAQTELEGLRQVLAPYTEARQRLARVLGQMQAAGNLGDRVPARGCGDLRVTLRSPIRGTLVEAKATAGELVGANQPLFRVVNVEKLWIEADVSEYDLARVQQAPGASYRLAAYPDRVFPILAGSGRLVDIGAVVDADTRTLPIRYEVTNPDGLLRVGMFADLLVETNRRQKALAVPKDAVVDEGGEVVVYMQREGETFERRRVEVGIRDAEMVEIRSGLSAGERVATKGAYSIRLSTLSSAIPAHGHAH